MKLFKFYIVICCLFFISPNGIAQKITGTWEGYMTGEFIQVNIEQRGNELCGYSFDYLLDNKADYCYARFQGRYDPDRQLFFLSGQSFIKNSGSHVLMRIILWNEEGEGKNVLVGKVFTQSSIGNLFGLGGDNIMLKRVSYKPREMNNVMASCFPSPVPNNPPITKSAPVKPPVAQKRQPAPKIEEKAAEKQATVITKIPDVVKIDKPAEKIPAVKQPDKEIMRNMAARKSTEQNRLEVNVKKINLKVYDNGVVDNDTVSIFYNGKLLLSHQRLSEKAIELDLELDEHIKYHEITLYAENLGGIPPNTALIIITAGGKRYELRAKANLEENAVLIIEYVPTHNLLGN